MKIDQLISDIGYAKHMIETPDMGGGNTGRAIRALRFALKAAVAIQNEAQSVCHWKPEMMSDEDEAWRSDCGEVWSFFEGDPADNDVKFCQGCGRRVEIEPVKGNVDK